MRVVCWRPIVVLALVALLALGCDAPRRAPQNPGPSAELTKRAGLALLPGLQFGPGSAAHTYREIRSVDVAGSHFVPAADRWIVHYCVEYTSFASDTAAQRCDTSVEVYELDTKKWVGFARGAGTLYRWRLIDEKPAASTAPSERGGAGGAKESGAS
jgi:hypothetical protein